MPPREIFPNPQQIKALTSKSEAYVEKLRSFMPPQELTNSGDTPQGFEFRRPNEEEQQLLIKAEQFLDETFHFFSSITPKIHIPALCILQKKEADKTPFLDFPPGYVDMHSQIVLAPFNPKLPDGARTFLHIATHEFTHAKSRNLWIIGQKTSRRISGFNTVTERFHVDAPEANSDITNAHFFVALNEALTETLTILSCESLIASSWFQETYGEREKTTAISRNEFCTTHSIHDAEIVAVDQNSDKNPNCAISYTYERQIFSLLLNRIAQQSGIPRSDVFHLFVLDYTEGTMKRIKPLLRDTFGIDILRVLAVWTPHEREESQNIMDYLQEKDANIRDIMANNYLTRHGSLPQMP